MGDKKLVKTYVIGDKTFTQRQLVLGQIEFMAKRMSEIGTVTDAGKDQIIQLVMKNLDLVAAVLVPEGSTRGEVVKLCDEPGGLLSMVDFLRSELEWETAAEVVTDFLECNPISSFSSQLMKQMRTFQQTGIGPLLKPSSLKDSIRSSAAGTSAPGASSATPSPLNMPRDGSQTGGALSVSNTPSSLSPV